MTKKLNAMPYAQAHILEENGKIKLISYITTVIIVDTASGWVVCSGTYSQTTRKHISAFCKEIGRGLNYPLMKALALENARYNIYTGEIEGV